VDLFVRYIAQWTFNDGHVSEYPLLHQETANSAVFRSHCSFVSQYLLLLSYMLVLCVIKL